MFVKPELAVDSAMQARFGSEPLMTISSSDHVSLQQFLLARKCLIIVNL